MNSDSLLIDCGVTQIHGNLGGNHNISDWFICIYAELYMLFDWFSPITYHLLEYGGMMTSSSTTFCFCYRIKQVDSMPPWVCSVIDHRLSQNVVRTKKKHTRRSRAFHWRCYHILTSSVVYYFTDIRYYYIINIILIIFILLRSSIFGVH